LNGENVKAVIKVAAKGSLGDLFRKILIGGGDDANVHALGAIAAEAFEFLLLENAQKFGLEIERKIANFVEEERAAIGEFEAADFLADGAGEGAALVAEQFGFEQAAGNGGAIDFDEGPVAAGAEIVDGAGEELLAGAGFAEEKNGGSRGGGELDLREGALESGAFANDFFKVEFSADFFLEIELFFGEFVFQYIDFLEGQRILYRDGNLRGDLLEELDVLRGKRVEAAAGEIERAEGAALGNQRDAANVLQTVLAERVDDFAGVAIEFRATGQEGLASGDGTSGGRAIAGDGGFLLEKAGVARKIEGMDFEEAAGGVEEGETGVIVMDDAGESGDDAAEDFGEIAGGHEDVVDFEKSLEAVAFAGELRLIGLGGFEIQGVVHGDGDQTGDALHELELGVCNALGLETAKAHGAKAALRRRQRDDRERTDVMFADSIDELREARFFFNVGDDKRLLRLPDPAGGIVFDGRLRAGGFFIGKAAFEDVQAHDVARGIVKDEAEEVEVNDGVEARGEVVEKRGEIALLGDGLADFEQGFKLAPGVFERGGESHFRRRNDGFRHRKQDSTRVGGGST